MLNSSGACERCVDDSFYLTHFTALLSGINSPSPHTHSYTQRSHLMFIFCKALLEYIIINTIYQIKFAHFNLIMFIMLLPFTCTVQCAQHTYTPVPSWSLIRLTHTIAIYFINIHVRYTTSAPLLLCA